MTVLVCLLVLRIMAFYHPKEDRSLGFSMECVSDIGIMKQGVCTSSVMENNLTG